MISHWVVTQPINQRHTPANETSVTAVIISLEKWCEVTTVIIKFIKMGGDLLGLWSPSKGFPLSLTVNNHAHYFPQILKAV